MDDDFQERVTAWLVACLGPDAVKDKQERNHRFLEEALELVQACQCTRDEAHRLVDYVFDRPVGDIRQELGGTMTTLAALCNAHEQHMNEAREIELDRMWVKIDRIRAKHATKPKHSPLPGQ